MPQYRIYLHDEFGRFRGVEDLDCADDRQAIATARQRAGAEEMELWDRHAHRTQRPGAPHRGGRGTAPVLAVISSQ
jgi:hypothetical protein